MKLGGCHECASGSNLAFRVDFCSQIHRVRIFCGGRRSNIVAMDARRRAAGEATSGKIQAGEKTEGKEGVKDSGRAAVRSINHQIDHLYVSNGLYANLVCGNGSLSRNLKQWTTSIHGSYAHSHVDATNLTDSMSANFGASNSLILTDVFIAFDCG
jgi:hypothetical protein